MAIEFRNVRFGTLRDLSVSAPDGATIGVIGEKGSGVAELLRVAAGVEQAQQGEVISKPNRRLISPGDALNLSPVDILVLDHALAQHDALVRARTAVGLERLRRAGAVILLASHEETLLRNACDELWWIHEGRLAHKGDPCETLEAYRRHIAERVRAWGEAVPPRMAPTFRKGDNRAEIVSIETLGADGKPTLVWNSGENVGVRVGVKYLEPVSDPVLGILIRTRVGFEVYGTNTELEKIKFGPCAAGDVVRLLFTFRCDLCPHEYTLTVASHDPDGSAHDWLDDAIAFSVVDARSTAGVSNLRATVQVEKVAQAG